MERPTNLIQSLTPRSQAESWAIVRALQLYLVNTPTKDLDPDEVKLINGVLARSEGLE